MARKLTIIWPLCISSALWCAPVVNCLLRLLKSSDGLFFWGFFFVRALVEPQVYPVLPELQEERWVRQACPSTLIHFLTHLHLRDGWKHKTIRSATCCGQTSSMHHSSWTQMPTIWDGCDVLRLVNVCSMSLPKGVLTPLFVSIKGPPW